MSDKNPVISVVNGKICINGKVFDEHELRESKEDHAKDLEEMEKLGEKCKNIDLNPKINMEKAINLVKGLYISSGR